MCGEEWCAVDCVGWDEGYEGSGGSGVDRNENLSLSLGVRNVEVLWEQINKGN